MLAARPEGRFQVVFTPKHGSWLNLVEGFFAKAARSVLRHIRLGSKHELKQRIIEFIDDLNRDPVIHRWQYRIGVDPVWWTVCRLGSFGFVEHLGLIGDRR